jgi:translation initiation factor 1A
VIQPNSQFPFPTWAGKGGKNVKKGKKRDEGENRRDLIYKEDGQEYAQVLRMLGDGRLALQCYDDVARTGLIRGTMRRRVWINTGDIVLVGLREFQPDKADVIHKYSTEEARSLQAFGELPTNARINQTAVDMAMDGDGEEEEDMGFDFADL